MGCKRSTAAIPPHIVPAAFLLRSPSQADDFDEKMKGGDGASGPAGGGVCEGLEREERRND